MYKNLFLTGIGMIVLFGCLAAHAAGSSVTINYGIVQSVHTVTEESRHAGGAVTGGVIGALVGPRRHRGLRVLAGAGIGAAVQGSATGGTSQQYSVKLMSGGTSIVNTEQTEIRQGDCVAVEQGAHANIRRVSDFQCEKKDNSGPPKHHETSANSCQKVKTELANAETDEAIIIAAKKVRILCED
jgi:hypothetical protein